MAQLKQQAGPLGLLFLSVSAMIGSGWLFASLHAAKIAGAGAIWSWLIAAAVVILLALVFSELTTMLPKSGALVHMSHLSHGEMVGKVWGWILFLAYVTIAPIEVMAILTYANNYLPGLVDPHDGILTQTGMISAAILLSAVITLNMLAVKWVLMINSIATIWKIAIPIVTIALLIGLSFHGENFQVEANEVEVADIFSAVASGGIIFSLFGFRQAIDMAGETDNPARNIPFAVIGSLVIATLLYIGLQIAFIGAVEPTKLAHGWSSLHFEGITGPLATLSVAAGAVWWAKLLYADAIASPLATAFVAETAASRIIMANGETAGFPRSTAKVNAKGIPFRALIISYVVGLLFFFPFPSWQKMVNYLSSVLVLTYALGPIVLLHLRCHLPQQHRPFKLWWAWVLAPIAFVSANWVILWAGFETCSFLFGFLALLFSLYLAYFYLFGVYKQRPFGWRQSAWLAPYFVSLWTLLYFGPSELGGNDSLTLLGSMSISAFVSIVILAVALKSGLNPQHTRQLFEQMRDHATAA